jgi:hypothetical protein
MGHHKVVSHCLNSNNTQNVSAACKADKPCLMDAYTYCRHAVKKEHHECMQANSTHFSPSCQAELTEREAKHKECEEDSGCRKRDKGRLKGRWAKVAVLVIAVLAIITCVYCVVRRCRTKVEPCCTEPAPEVNDNFDLEITQAKSVMPEQDRPAAVVATPMPAYSPPNERMGEPLLPVVAVQQEV